MGCAGHRRVFKVLFLFFHKVIMGISFIILHFVIYIPYCDMCMFYTILCIVIYFIIFKDVIRKKMIRTVRHKRKIRGIMYLDDTTILNSYALNTMSNL